MARDKLGRFIKGFEPQNNNIRNLCLLPLGYHTHLHQLVKRGDL